MAPVNIPQTPLISTDAPGYGVASVPSGQFGNTEQAISNLGQTLTHASLSILGDVKRAEALDAVNQAKQKDMFDSEDYLAQLKKSAPDGYIIGEDGKKKLDEKGNPITITQAYKEWANKRYMENQGSMPSGAAQDLYRQEMSDYFGGQTRKAQADELTLQTDSYKRNAMQSGLTLHNRLVDTPSIDTAYAGLDDGRLQIARNRAYVGKNGIPTGIFSQAEADALDKDLKEKVTEGVFQGLRNQILEASPTNKEQLINQALQVLRGQDQRSQARKKATQDTLSDIMPEEKKGAYEAELLRMKKSASERSFGELSSVIQDESYSLRNGRARSGAVDRLFNAKEAAADSPDALREIREQRSRVEHQLTSDELVGKMTQEMRKLPTKDWQGVIDSFDQRMDANIAASAKKRPGTQADTNPNFGQAIRENAKAYLYGAQDQIQKERNADGAAYVATEFKTVAAALEAAKRDPSKMPAALDMLVKKQQEIGIPVEHQRVITKQQSKDIARMLNTNNPTAAEQAMTMLQQTYGDYWGRVNDQINADGSLDSERQDLTMVAQMRDPRSREELAANVINRTQINQAYENAVPEAAKRKLLTGAVYQEVSPYVQAVQGQSYDGNTAGLSNNIYKAVDTQAKKLKIADMNSGGKTPESEIAKRAMAIVTRDYQFIESGNSKFIVPAADGNRPIDKRIVQSYADTHRSAAALETMGIQVPKAISSQPDYAKLPPDEQKKTYFRTIEQRGAWKTDASGHGLVLVTINNDGTWAAVKRKDGSPYVVKFRDIVSKQDQFTNEGLKGGLINRGADNIDKAVEGTIRGFKKAAPEVYGDQGAPLTF